METPSNSDLARNADLRSRVNEKLIKALLALLTIKDEHLLDELRVVFGHAQRQGGEIGEATPDVWAGVREQVSVLMELVAHEDEAEIESEARRH